MNPSMTGEKIHKRGIKFLQCWTLTVIVFFKADQTRVRVIYGHSRARSTYKYTQNRPVYIKTQFKGRMKSEVTSRMLIAAFMYFMLLLTQISQNKTTNLAVWL